MADDRTRTIIKEIQYWKEHKLLPETQCDFLLALYTQGEGIAHPDKKWKHNLLYYLQLILLSFMVPFSFLVVYFTQFNIILQLSILVLSLGIAFWIVLNFYKRKNSYVHLALIVFLVLLLIVTDFITNLLHVNQFITVLFFILNFIGWYLVGRRFQYRYLMIFSILAIFVLFFVNFSHLFSFN